MNVLARSTWRCPACGWSYSYDEPMTDVFCVACFQTGRGQNVRCEEWVPATHLQEAVDDNERLRRENRALWAREHARGHRYSPDCPVCVKFGGNRS